MREAQGSLRGRVDTAAGDDDSQLQDQLVDTSGRVEQPTSEDRRSRKEGKKDGRKESRKEVMGSGSCWILLMDNAPVSPTWTAQDVSLSLWCERTIKDDNELMNTYMHTHRNTPHTQNSHTHANTYTHAYAHTRLRTHIIICICMCLYLSLHVCFGVFVSISFCVSLFVSLSLSIILK